MLALSGHPTLLCAQHRCEQSAVVPGAPAFTSCLSLPCRGHCRRAAHTGIPAARKPSTEPCGQPRRAGQGHSACPERLAQEPGGPRWQPQGGHPVRAHVAAQPAGRTCTCFCTPRLHSSPHVWLIWLRVSATRGPTCLMLQCSLQQVTCPRLCSIVPVCVVLWANTTLHRACTW